MLFLTFYLGLYLVSFNYLPFLFLQHLKIDLSIWKVLRKYSHLILPTFFSFFTCQPIYILNFMWTGLKNKHSRAAAKMDSSWEIKLER